MMHAAPITYSIVVDLSSFHAGSSYSGSVTLADALTIGQSTPITLTASPGGFYSPTTLNQTLSLGTGPFGFNSVFLSPVVFTDLATALQYNLIVNGAAHCDISNGGIPCDTVGQLIGGNANGGVATYHVTIAPAASAVPEPAYGLPLMLTAVAGVAMFRSKRRSGRAC